MFAYYKVPEPKPEPPDDPPLDSDHELTATWPKRRQARLRFERWLFEQGHYGDDAAAVALTDDEIDYLARHVLP